MIDDYLTLTTRLVRGYIESYAPKHLTSKLVESGRLNQYLISNEDELKVTVNISEVSEAIYLVNFVTKGNEKVDTVLIDWNSDTLKIEMPVEDITPELQAKFDGRIDLGINNKLSKPFHGSVSSDDERSKDMRPQHSHVLSANAVSCPSGTTRRIPDMPDFEDEYEILKKDPNSGEKAFPSIGDRDLNPPGLPKYPEMRPYVDPTGGYGDGGMYPLMDHPIFGGRRTDTNSSRLGVPPGARFDDPMGGSNSDVLGGMGGNPGSGNLGRSGFPGFGSSGPGSFGF